LKKGHYSSSHKRYTSYFLAATLILLVYTNTFNASWQFDDKPNILNNTYIHLTDLKPESIIKTLYTNPSKPAQLGDRMYRPVACLSLALNWYIGGDHVAGYHIINTAIHILATLVLYLVIVNLYKTPNLIKHHGEGVNFIALFAALLWALHPIQIQAVTYIVQRMTSLAALFYLLSIYFYLKSRMSALPWRRASYYAGCALSFMLALGSKENAATLPLALVLIEIIFFQKTAAGNRNRRFYMISAGFLLISLVLMLQFLPGSDFFFAEDYAKRTFTVSERLMTEFRVVFLYLSQLFYPLADRFSIEHDVLLSTSLWTPWTTLPSMLAILLLITTGFGLMWKMKVLSFSILFFFLNHLIESTIVPLELVFEHRNYLPSLFFFLPLSVGIKSLLDYYREKSTVMHVILVVFATLLLTSVGFSTHLRNFAWATERSLWEDAMHKAPNSARPLTVLAEDLSRPDLANPQDDAKALVLYERALLLQQSRRNVYPAILNNMAVIYMRNDNKPKALAVFTEALAIDPDYQKARAGLIQVQIMQGQWDRALENAEQLVSVPTPLGGHLNLMGYVLLRQEQYETARNYFQEALRLEPNDPVILLNMGIALCISGHYEDAEGYLQRAYMRSPEKFNPLIMLIENSSRAGDRAEAGQYADTLLDSYPTGLIQAQLKQIQNSDYSLSIPLDASIRIVAKRMAERSEALAQ